MILTREVGWADFYESGAQEFIPCESNTARLCSDKVA